MSTEPTHVEGGPAPSDAEHAWTSHDLAALDQLMRRVRHQQATVEDLTLEVELDTAREELRVADEEIRVQKDQLDELLALRQAATVQRRRVAALLPVPMVSTDTSGRIDEANAAAAARLNVPLLRLVGKPLVTFVHEDDRGAVRQALSRVATEPARLQVRLTPRRSDPVLVDLVLTAEPGPAGPAEVEWTVLTPVDGATGRREVDPMRLAAAVAEISRLPVAQTDLRALLTEVARVARTALEDATSISVNLGHPAEPTHIASTSEEAALVDGLQVRTGQGPCVDAYDDGETVLVDDLRTEARWPRLSAALPESAAVSVLAVPVMAGGHRVGMLNCYGTAPETFAEPHAQAGEVLALAAGAALEAVQENGRLRRLAEQLDQALESRAVIDQAKGIVMAHRGCTADEAFTHLATLSQQRNVKLRELARQLVEQTGAASAGVSRRRS